MRFYYHPHPTPELINFFKPGTAFPLGNCYKPVNSLLALLLLCEPLDVTMANVIGTSCMGTFHFKLLKIKYHANTTSSVTPT